MTTSIIWYKGELRCEMIHVNSGKEITTDAPTDNNGKGESFSPTDLLSSALASCMITIMAIRAEKSDFKLNKVEADVTKKMASNPRRVEQVDIKMRVEDTGYSDKEKKILLEAAKNCPVARSLHSDIIQNLEIVYVSNLNARI